jgi:hypothetical protein
MSIDFLWMFISPKAARPVPELDFPHILLDPHTARMGCPVSLSGFRVALSRYDTPQIRDVWITHGKHALQNVINNGRQEAEEMAIQEFNWSQRPCCHISSLGLELLMQSLVFGSSFFLLLC